MKASIFSHPIFSPRANFLSMENDDDMLLVTRQFPWKQTLLTGLPLSNRHHNNTLYEGGFAAIYKTEPRSKCNDKKMM
jgi:hypothetical protein